MKLILSAVPSSDQEEMVLNLFAKMRDMPENTVREAARTAAGNLKIDLRDVKLEFCYPDNDADTATIEAEWYAVDDPIAPEIGSTFDLGHVYLAIVRILMTSPKWQRIKPLGKGKATWQLNRIQLDVRPYK